MVMVAEPTPPVMPMLALMRSVPTEPVTVNSIGLRLTLPYSVGWDVIGIG